MNTTSQNANQLNNENSENVDVLRVNLIMLSTTEGCELRSITSITDNISDVSAHDDVFPGEECFHVTSTMIYLLPPDFQRIAIL